MSAFSIKTWTNKGYTEEEAKYQIAIRRPNNILYYINKGFTKEEAEEKIDNCFLLILAEKIIKIE